MRTLLLVAAAMTASATAAEAAADAGLSARATAVLAEYCVSCHGPEKQKGDLRLDSREAALKGGEHGPAIVPGQPQDSPLVQVLMSEDPDQRMPPPKAKKQPNEQQIADLVAWVQGGAEWPAAQ